jgi:hypothetical protein
MTAGYAVRRIMFDYAPIPWYKDVSFRTFNSNRLTGKGHFAVIA